MTAQVTLSGGPKSRYFPIQIGEAEFEVEITEPTLEQRRTDVGLMTLGYDEPAKWIAHRIHAAVTGWRGLENPDGSPVEFSPQNLDAVCCHYPKVERQFRELAHEAFLGLPEDTEKN